VNSDLSSSNQPTVAPPGPMSRRARFAAALQHKQPDRPPFDIGATCPMSWLRDQKGLADFLGLPGEPRPVGAWGFDERIMEWADADFRGTGRIVELPGPHSRTISPMSYVNCWGIRWEFIDDEWQITGHPLEGVEDMAALQSFPWPEPRVDEALLATWVDEARSLRARGDHVVLAEHPVLGVMELGAWRPSRTLSGISMTGFWRSSWKWCVSIMERWDPTSTSQSAATILEPSSHPLFRRLCLAK